MDVVGENIVCCSGLVGVTNGDTAACTGDTSFTMHPPTHTLTFLFSFSSSDKSADLVQESISYMA